MTPQQPVDKEPEEVDEKVFASLSRKDAMHIFHVQMDTVRIVVDSFRRVADSLNRVAEMLHRTLPEAMLEEQQWAKYASVDKVKPSEAAKKADDGSIAS